MVKWRNKEMRERVLSSLSDETIIVIFDTETTGLTDNDEVIELAAKKYRVSRGNLYQIDSFHEYFKPTFAISEKITEITGLTNEFLEDKPSYEEKHEEIKAFFKDSLLCAYNTPFDIKMMNNMYRKMGEIFAEDASSSLDVLVMARDIVSKKECEKHNLGTIASYYGVDEGLTFHSALDDVEATKRLFEIFIEEYKEEPEEGTLTPTIFHVAFWEGYRGFSRIYVQTNYGSLYYSIRERIWGTKDAPIDEINMKYIEEKCLEITGSSNLDIFAKFKGSITV